MTAIRTMATGATPAVTKKSAATVSSTLGKFATIGYRTVLGKAGAYLIALVAALR